MHKREKGYLGEEIACQFLRREGFKIIGQNYQKVWGELDIIAQKDQIVHFFEVKSMTVTFNSGFYGHKPEENVDGWKIKHLRRIIETYLGETNRGLDVEFHFHVLCVYMNMSTRRARVKWMNDIIL